MGELDIYNMEDVSYSFRLDDIENNSSKYSTVDEELYNKKFIHQNIVPDTKGANSDQMELGYMGNGEWVFLKSDLVNLGTAAAAHLGAYTVLNQTDLNIPDMDYSQGNIIMEHLGSFESPLNAINEDPSNYDALVDSIAAKAILGDGDIGGNIGFKQGNFYIFDFDRAGESVKTAEDEVREYLDRIDRLTEIDACLEDVESAMAVIANSVNISELERSLDNLFGSIEQQTEREVAEITSRDFIRNIEYVRDGEFFDNYVDSRTSFQEEEPVESETQDIFRKNIQEAMLD